MNARRLLLLLVLFAGWARGATAAEITIVQSLPLTGTQSTTGKSINAGASLYIDWLNARGGVEGKRVRLVAYDDEQAVDKTLSNVRTLLAREQPLVLLGVGQ
jgi:branched-chain amino acid transport system substrate-binding protein